MVADTSVDIAGVRLKNPVIPASGTYGYGADYMDFYDPNLLGAIALKGTTLERRFGNAAPRIAECEAGMLNSIGLQNPGIQSLLENELPRLRRFYNGPIIANVGGFTAEEYADCCGMLDGEVDIIEINISCPNVHGGGLSFGRDVKSVASITRLARARVTKTPLFIKLSPNVTDIAEIARACETEGADGLSLINTLIGMRIDLYRRKPVLANKTGGFSGRAVFPVALAMVYAVSKAVKIPVMGMGGVSCAGDVIEMMMAGAAAVQVGAENLSNPMVCAEIIDDLPILLAKLGVERAVDIISAIE